MHQWALTIAGSDPTGGAGVQADLKTFAALGVYGLSIITALTAQNASGVHQVYAVPPSFVRAQLESLLTDFQIDAFKIGMVYKIGLIKELTRLIKRHHLKNLVLDPVVKAGAGGDLIQEGGLDVLKEDLLPMSTVLTPNLDEASLLAGLRIQDLDDMREAARRIYNIGPRFVLIKGGHLSGEIRDLLFDGQTYTVTPMERVPAEIHGTGCTLSAAIAAGLAKGLPVPEAIAHAQTYTQRVIHKAFSFKKGRHYPDHFAQRE